MRDLAETLTELNDKISRYRDSSIGEQNTKAVLIEPLLRELGWNIEDFDEVQREFKPVPTDNPVDYALLIHRKPLLFVEAKALGEDLNNRKWANQIISYATMTGVEWVVLTDGDDYRLYNAHAPVRFEEKLFRSARISEDRTRATEILALLSKNQIQANSIHALWQSDFVDRQVQNVIESLFGPDPDPKFVRFLRTQLPNLAPSEVKAGLSRLRIQIDSPSPPAHWTLPIGQPRVTHVQPQLTPTNEPAGGHENGTPWRNITLQDLIEHGLLNLPLEIHKAYKGRQLTARITENGRVTLFWTGV